MLQTTTAHVSEAARSVVARVDGSVRLVGGTVASARQSSRRKRYTIILRTVGCLFFFEELGIPCIFFKNLLFGRS